VREDRPPAVSSTYRVQLRPGFGFEAAADQAGYLADLGVTHVYLSPILQAAPGSAHGYDVVDHSRISAELGGETRFRAMATRLAGHGVGIVVDIVPNHMSVPDLAYLNRPLWSVLRDGRQSPHAHWFDVDWAAAGDRMVLPILPGPLPDCLDDFRVGALSAVTADAGEPATDLGDEPVLRFGERVLPLRPGTQALPIRDLLDAQAYRLDSWRAAGAFLNWRRFLDITSLIAIRVEEPDVFAATHGLLLGLVAEGLITGLRVDHVDGLADPGGYLHQLAVATGGSWVVAEKVVALGEELPADWACAGTTGYDALAAVGSLFTDPAGVTELGSQYARIAGPGTFAEVAWTARREMAGGELSAEVGRLARLLGHVAVPALTGLNPDDRVFIVAELLAAMTVYRAYVTPGGRPPSASVRELEDATSLARRRTPRRLHGALGALAEVLLGGNGEVLLGGNGEVRSGHRVPALADAGRGVAGAGRPADQVPAQGHARGKDVDFMDRPGPRLRGIRLGTGRGDPGRPGASGPDRCLCHPDHSRCERELARGKARPAHDARRPRRLSGLRAGRLLARRPG
jgi:(1->4)-alpha-D-glucan 1-alpha-D-glucosylmutase